jgi:TatD DNase family protein
LPAFEPSSTLQLFDTHCHLDAAEFDAERDALVSAAHSVGVTRILVPSVCAANFDATLRMRQRYGCLLAFGLHPLYTPQHLDHHLALLESRLAHQHPVAVGEIGLDAFLPHSDLPAQEALFIEQLKLARQHDLPVILHMRRAADRVLKYLRRYPQAGGIAHAFNGSEQQAREFIRLGFKLGFGGAISYSGSLRIRALAATLPLSALVLETDAPDMRPQWAPGTANRPQNLARFAAILAQLRGVSVEEIARQTTGNAEQVFGLAALDPG